MLHERLVALERHRLDVEPGPFGVEAREVAEGVLRGGDRHRRRRPGPTDDSMRSSWIGRAASWIGSARSARAFASASSRIERRPGSTSSSSPGPSRPRRTVSAAVNGTAPASEATATSRSRVTAKGGRPQPVPVDQDADVPAVGEDDRGRPVPRREEAGRPAAERGHVRMRRATQRERLGDRGQERGCQLPAGRRQKLERLVERQRIGAVLGQQRTGGEERARHRRNRPTSAARPRTCSRLPRTVLISPLWAIDRNGWARPPDRMRVRRIALVEDRVAERQRLPQVRVEVGQAAADDQALVDDRPRRGGRHGQLGQRRHPPRAPRSRAVAARRPAVARRRRRRSVAGRRRHGSAGRRPPARTPGATPRPRLRAPSMSTGTARQRRPAGRPRRRSASTSARARALGQRGRAAGTARRPPGRSAASASPAIRPRSRAIERQRDTGAVARLAVGAECPSMAERGQAGEGQRQDPVARAPAGVRDEPDATRVVLEARLVERGDGATVALGRCGGSMACLREGDGPAAIDEESTAAGGWSRRVRPGGGRRSHLIGDLAVDGTVEAHRLDLGLDPDAEEDIDDLDDHERADDRVPDRGADGDELDAELRRVAVEQAGVRGLDRATRRRCRWRRRRTCRRCRGPRRRRARRRPSSAPAGAWRCSTGRRRRDR